MGPSASDYKGTNVVDHLTSLNAEKSDPRTRAQQASAAVDRNVVAARIRDLVRNAARSTKTSGDQTLPWLHPEQRGSIKGELKPAKRVTVLLADDHPVVREGLVALINAQPDMEVVGQAGNGREALKQFAALNPDVALLDLRMPLMDGVETVTAICEAHPAARVVILTTYENEEDIYQALRAGAQGYLVKEAPVSELVECIRTVGAGKTWIPAGVGAKLAKRIADRELTKREMEVLRAVAAGKSNKEIGLAFSISEATVKVHVTHILEKLRVTGRTEAINIAVKRGLVRIEGNSA